MTPEAALAELMARADPDRAEQMQAYHKVPRLYLGLSNAVSGELATQWRKSTDLSTRVNLAQGLWESNIYEARIAAGKLFIQARMKPDDGPAWDWITSVVPQFDSWAIADAVAMSGQKRVVQDPTRLDMLEAWTGSDHLWTRRASLVFALPFCKSRHPGKTEAAARTRIFSWCATLSQDTEWFIQKAVAWWLRDLSKRDPNAVAAFLSRDTCALKPWARREAGKYLPTEPAPENLLPNQKPD